MQTVQPYSSVNVTEDISSLLRITVPLGTSLRSEGLCTLFSSHTLSPPSFFLKPSSSPVTTGVCPFLVSLTQLRALLHLPCSVQWLTSFPHSCKNQTLRSNLLSPSPQKAESSYNLSWGLRCPAHRRLETNVYGKDINTLSQAHTCTYPTLHISKIINASKNALPPTNHLPCSFTLIPVSLPPPPWFYKAVSEVKSMLCRLKATLSQALSFIYLWILSIYYKT